MLTGSVEMGGMNACPRKSRAKERMAEQRPGIAFSSSVMPVVTGANVHDSQLAIPMEKWTERKITYLYSVMDSAYDAHPIVGYIPITQRGSFARCTKDPSVLRTQAASLGA
jgi:hypothetical protein